MSKPSPFADVEVPQTDVTSFVLGRAEELGEKPALIDGPSGRTITYAGLAEAIRSFSAGLAANGFGPGDALAIYMPNVPEYAIAFHGAAAAGGRATTANPLYTARELEHQLRDSGARMLLTVPPFIEIAKEAAAAAGVEDIFVLGDGDGVRPFSDLMGDSAAAPSPSIDPEEIAVLPYSSGTTGLPKGVMLTHRNLVANLVQTRAANLCDESSVVIGVLPFFHIYGQTVIMNLNLVIGATTVTMPRFDLDQFLGLIEEHRVTHAYVVPPIALALAKHPAVEGRDLSSIQMIMSGAAPLGPELTTQLADRISNCTVTQGYGLTETSPVTHMMPLDEAPDKPGSIGYPLSGTECRLVDPESGDESAEGERGEVWVRGPQVMKGYLNNPEATADTVDAEGWLHTGDIGVCDPDGTYRIVDRLKELIKYKGFQVPPAELEAILIAHPEVADCAVIGVPDDEAGELPKAYVVPAGENLDHVALMAHVAEQVSPQKRIRLIEEIDEIPKSPSGKILRRILKDREAAADG